MITVTPAPDTLPVVIHCPRCDNQTSFHLVWLGDLAQDFHQDVQGERDYDSHDNEGDRVNVDAQILCRTCDAVVAERPITVHVGAWEFPAGALPQACPSDDYCQRDGEASS